MHSSPLANDPGRRTQELNDIERLAGLYGPKLDWERIENFYRLFGLEEEAMRLEERFGNAE